MICPSRSKQDSVAELGSLSIFPPSRSPGTMKDLDLHPSSSHSPTTLLPAYVKNQDRFISQSPSLITTLWDVFTRS